MRSESGLEKCLCAEKGSCTAGHRMVCGSDGNMYESHCDLHRSACVSSKKIYVDHKGEACYQKGNTSIHDKWFMFVHFSHDPHCIPETRLYFSLFTSVYNIHIALCRELEPLVAADRRLLTHLIVHILTPCFLC